MRNRTGQVVCALAACLSVVVSGVLSAGDSLNYVQAREDVITLRVCSWEEYIDLGDWDEEERIELDNGVEVMGEQALYDEFEEWYFETYGKRVEVEYSCFGTNEDLYNQLTLGDTYDLVCPSDYMIMKLMAEGELEPYSGSFYDKENEENYYTRCVSPYIADVFEKNQINGESWSRYAAGYMWGVTGVLYNPELMTEEEASTWAVFDNPDFYRQITLKDNVRDTYFSTLGYLLKDQLTDRAFLEDPDYQEKLGDMMNDVSPGTIEAVEEMLGGIMGNIYALETDSGKADMVTGKIIANYQWSGDAVYAMDQAQEEDVYLRFAVPRECTNLWFDGWVMLKDGIGEDMEKKHAAEAFVNFLSKPVNAVRNMYYIGYTSAISGGEDDTVFSYLNWCYGAEDEEDTVAYPVGYFFSGDSEDEDYIVHAAREQIGRQLYTQYPSQEVISRAAVMGYFDEEQTRNINQMWINIRCLDVREIPLWCVLLTLCIATAVVAAVVLHKKIIIADKNLLTKRACLCIIKQCVKRDTRILCTGVAMFIHLSDVFTSEGRKLDTEARLEMTDFDNGTERFEIVDKSALSLAITPLETGKVLVKADGQITLRAACDRCLAEVPVKLDLHTERVVFSPDRKAKEDADDQNFVDGYELDVEALAHDIIIGNWPAKILCKKDCKGICPVCGQNLNVRDCGCDSFVPDPRMAVIQDIFNAER